ncbi:MAG: DUF1501 domain-containing protein [Saprospiraceae bacterium]
MGKHHHHIDRRKFLGQASCAAIGTTTFLSSILNLKAMGAASILNSATSAAGDYKAIVCLLNSGGADSFNMLIPRENEDYQTYAATRSNMAIPSESIIPLSGTGNDGKSYGVHPSFPRFASMYNEGKLAFITNIGTLVQPITRQQFWEGNTPLPLGLYSHSDQVMHWQTGMPDKRESIGWGGRIADLLTSANENRTLSMNLTLSGSNIFQTGNSSIEYSINPIEGALQIYDFNESWVVPKMRRQAIERMLQQSYSNIFKDQYVSTIKQSIEGADYLNAALALPNNFDEIFTPFAEIDSEGNVLSTDEYGRDNLSNSFKTVARIIAGHETTKLSRQIFFIDFNGWDHHDNLLENQTAMFTGLDTLVYDFQRAMESIGMSDQVTVFSMSEFSRTLTSNGNGTDHAWGGNVFVSGGAVQGGKMYGQFPDLRLGLVNDLEIGGGVLIPTTSVDTYFAELALWFGVPKSELSSLFPKLGNFYDQSSTSNPIGFLKS